MKNLCRSLFFIGLLLLAVSFSGCRRKLSKPVEKVEEYNTELRDFSQKSGPSPSLDEFNEVNREFSENDLSRLTLNDFRELKSTEEFNALLAREKLFLNDWKPIANFPNYNSPLTDTLRKLIKRCATFDTAGPETPRTPSFGRMNMVSLRYYKYEIPVAFHVVKMTNGVGNIPNMQQKFADQIALLNAVYAKFNVSFILSSIDQTINNVWHMRGCAYQDPKALREMTNALSIHPEKTLNVYTTGIGLLGEASFPWEKKQNGTKGDYIVINYNSLPGGPVDFAQGLYTQGKTLVHEAGHYMGLFHTFEGGPYKCDDPANNGCGVGDQVDDTPAQKICYFDGCGLDGSGQEQDSCPEPGKDPVKNYMGYNPDACMSELTSGQVKRMLWAMYKFRLYFAKTVV